MVHGRFRQVFGKKRSGPIYCLCGGVFLEEQDCLEFDGMTIVLDCPCGRYMYIEKFLRERWADIQRYMANDVMKEREHEMRTFGSIVKYPELSVEVQEEIDKMAAKDISAIMELRKPEPKFKLALEIYVKDKVVVVPLDTGDVDIPQHVVSLDFIEKKYLGKIRSNVREAMVVDMAHIAGRVHYRLHKAAKERVMANRYETGRKFVNDPANDVSMYRVLGKEYGVGLCVHRITSLENRVAICLCSPEDMAKGKWSDRKARKLLGDRILTSPFVTFKYTARLVEPVEAAKMAFEWLIWCGRQGLVGYAPAPTLPEERGQSCDVPMFVRKLVRDGKMKAAGAFVESIPLGRMQRGG